MHRHDLTVGALILRPLRSLCPVFCDIPRAFTVPIMLKMHQLGFKSLRTVYLCTLTSCESLWWSLTAAKRRFSGEGELITALTCGCKDYAFKTQLERTLVEKRVAVGSPLGPYECPPPPASAFRLTVPGMNSFLLSWPQVQLGRCWATPKT